jgi:hypothetical protein
MGVHVLVLVLVQALSANFCMQVRRVELCRRYTICEVSNLGDYLGTYPLDPRVDIGMLFICVRSSILLGNLRKTGESRQVETAALCYQVTTLSKLFVA